MWRNFAESNNIAIQGLMEYAEKTGKKHIITTSIEHKAILETVKALEKKENIYLKNEKLRKEQQQPL